MTLVVSPDAVRTSVMRSLAAVAFVLLAFPVLGQQASQPDKTPGANERPKPAPKATTKDRVTAESQISDSVERIGENHIKRIGHVEFVQGDSSLYADEVEIFQDENRAIATGNVVLTQGTNRIAADRADFNTETMLGTFYKAWGLATIQPPKQTARPGGGLNAPTQSGAETDVYFYGDEIVKQGPKKYRITNGGFTTCVQPTPRWHLTSKTTVLNIDHYTLLREAVFNVKGVPLLYTPFLYYPTKKDRATGFLIPTYGTSTVRGHALHNAFFWAVDRSEDVTVMHDWFSNQAQGVGGEYRYNYGGGSNGGITTYWLDQQQTTVTGTDGSTSALPATRSYEIRGTANQLLFGNFRARGRVDYFSDLTTMQTFNTNIYDASRVQRTYGGNIVGVTHGFSVNGTFDHSEYFYTSSNTSAVTGSWPRLNISKNERPLFGSDLYFLVNGELVSLLRTNKSPAGETDSGLVRYDFNPQIRYPFKKWQWFTVNSTLAFRDTFYTRSLDSSGHIVDESLNRNYVEFRSQLLGPVFTRVWNTPDNSYAEKFKHTVEPFVNLTRTSAIDNFNQIVQLDGTDAVVGDAASYTYGVNNRIYAKRRPEPNSFNRTGQARDILDIGISQSYYTDARSAQYDQQYATSFNGNAPNHYSPIALNIHGAPTNNIDGTVRAEFDSQYHVLRTISAGGSYSLPNMLTITSSWSKRSLIPQLPGFTRPDQYLRTVVNAHTRDNRFGGIHSLDFDLLNSTVLQQRLTAFYNAQCCGVAFEYQTYNLSGTSLTVPKDRRFFISFTLAGLGNFSPFNGAMGGVPR